MVTLQSKETIIVCMTTQGVENLRVESCVRGILCFKVCSQSLDAFKKEKKKQTWSWMWNTVFPVHTTEAYLIF